MSFYRKSETFIYIINYIIGVISTLVGERNMIFSRRKDKTVNELENILLTAQPDEQLRRTLLETYKTLREVAKECSNPFNPLHYRDEKGLFIYLNYQEGSQLHVNGNNATFFKEAYSIYEPSGKKLLRKMVGRDGAIEESIDGLFKSCRRKLGADNYDEVAVQKGLIKNGKEVTAAQLGFDEKARKKPVFCKHYAGKTATGIDPNLWLIILSSTGDIVIMHDYKNVYSTVRSEIHPEYLKLLDRTESTSPPQINYASNAPRAQGMHTPHAKIGEGLALSCLIRKEALSYLRYAHY